MGEPSPERRALYHRLIELFNELDQAVKRGDTAKADACLTEVAQLTKRTSTPPMGILAPPKPH